MKPATRQKEKWRDAIKVSTRISLLRFLLKRIWLLHCEACTVWCPTDSIVSFASFYCKLQIAIHSWRNKQRSIMSIKLGRLTDCYNWLYHVHLPNVWFRLSGHRELRDSRESRTKNRALFTDERISKSLTYIILSKLIQIGIRITLNNCIQLHSLHVNTPQYHKAFRQSFLQTEIKKKLCIKNVATKWSASSQNICTRGEASSELYYANDEQSGKVYAMNLFFPFSNENMFIIKFQTGMMKPRFGF